MAIDLLGADAEIWIDKNGKFVPFQSVLGIGSAFVERVKVKIGLMNIVNMEIHLAPPLKEAIQLLNSGSVGLGFTVQTKTNQDIPSFSLSNPLAGIGNALAGASAAQASVNRVAIRLLYGGLKSPYFKGILLQPELELGPEGIDITMKAIGMLFEASQTYASASFPDNTTRRKIIEKLVGNNFKLKTDKTADKKLNKPRKAYTSTSSAFESIQSILKEVDCKMYVAGATSPNTQETLVITSVHNARTGEKRGSTFVAYRQINPNAREFPLLNLSAVISNLMIPGGPMSEYKISVIDGKTKKVKTDTAGSKSYVENRTNVAASADGTMPGAPVKGKTGLSGESSGIANSEQSQRTHSMPSPRGDDGILDKAKGYVHDYIDSASEFNITSVGIADLLPGRMIGIAVADIKALSADYDLTEVEHDWSSGGAETHMVCKRTFGLASSLSQGVGKAVALGAATLNGSSKTSTPITGNQ